MRAPTFYNINMIDHIHKKNEELYWVPCHICKSSGKIFRGPSNKRRRLFQEAILAFEKNNKQGKAPEQPQENLDVCFDCGGSGLVCSADGIKPDYENYPKIAIIGGGIGGAALAVACLQRGIPFTLYERDESFSARSQGYGLTLQQASNAIAGFGIANLDEGVTSTRHIVYNASGKVIGEWGLRKWKKQYIENSTKRKNVHIARQTLRSLLFEKLANCEFVKWGHTLIDISDDNKITNLTFKIGKNRETVQVDLVVGADGIRSKVRELTLEEERNPLQYLGCMVILGICTRESLTHCKSDLFDSATVFQTVNGYERIYVMPYNKDSIMWQISFPLSEIDAKELSSKGPQTMKDEVIKRFQWHSPIPEILEVTPYDHITGYPVYDRQLLDQNLLQEHKNITLIGDAAHPMSPFKGQGANQALLDALMLARRIFVECGKGLHWRDIGIRNAVLTKFENDMLERVSSKVEGSAKAVKLLHSNAVLHEGDAPRGRGITG